MDLTRAIDAYCERSDPGYWAEPVNAVTNGAFLLVALVMWTRLRGHGAGLARLLVAVQALIGVGSFLFHTHAQAWAALADVVPILVFILVYIFAINRDVWGLPAWRAAGLAALVLPFAALAAPVFGLLPIGGSAGYAPVPLLILIYAALLWRREPAVARGFVAGAVILVVSLTARTLDEPLCAALPAGTHFLWHVLNAAMLGWMIEVYSRHLLIRTATTGDADAVR